MIHYTTGTYQFGFVFRLQGSVFPKASVYAVPAFFAAIALKIFLTYLDEMNEMDTNLMESLESTAAYSGFTFVVGFLLVFRTSQAYTRFWEGATMVHNMRTEWFDACSSLIAFTQHSKDDKGAEELRHLMVRLFSLLHSCALQDIADMEEEEFELIDIRGLDEDSLNYLHLIASAGLSQVDVVFQWIQSLITFHQDTGLIKAAPPILSRVFQELAGGMIKFSSAKKITDTPFPFPYAQMIACLLLLHWVLTPLVMCAWTNHWLWSGICTFVSVFSLWCINFIASEIEQPFGDDTNDLPTRELQIEMNKLLLLLLDPRTSRLPYLNDNALVSLRKIASEETAFQSFHQAMEALHAEKGGPSERSSPKPLLSRGKSVDMHDDSVSKTKRRSDIVAHMHQLKSFEMLKELSRMELSSLEDESSTTHSDSKGNDMKPWEAALKQSPSSSNSVGDSKPPTNATDGPAQNHNESLQATSKPLEEKIKVDVHTARQPGTHKDHVRVPQDLQNKNVPELGDQNNVSHTATLNDVVDELRRGILQNDRMDEVLTSVLKELTTLSNIGGDLITWAQDSPAFPPPRNTQGQTIESRGRPAVSNFSLLSSYRCSPSRLCTSGENDSAKPIEPGSIRVLEVEHLSEHT